MPWFYRTSARAEINLVIEQGPNKIYAIEIKRSVTPTVSKGFSMDVRMLIQANGLLYILDRCAFPFQMGPL